MRQVSNEFKLAVGGQNRQISSRLLVEGTPNFEISEELENFKIETAGAPFGVSMKKLTAKVFSTEIDFIGKIITPEFSVNNHALKLEPFEIAEAKINLENGTTEISSFDAMLKTHRVYQKNAHIYPCSMGEFVEQICVSCGLELDSNFELPGQNLEIQIDYFEKIHQMSYRDILRQIAEVAGGIFLARGGKLAFSKLLGGQIAVTLTDFDLKKLTLKEKTPPLNSLVLSRSPQEDNIYFRREPFDFENLSELKIINNELVDKRRSEVAESIFERVEGLSWQGFVAETFGFGFLEAGDKIAVNAGGSSFESFVTNSVLEVGQSLKEKFETAPLTPTITNYQRASDIIKKIHNTEIVVDKQNQQIESIVAEQTEQAGVVREEFSRITQDLKNINISVQKAGGLNLLKNSAFYSFDKDKNPNFWEFSKLPTFEASSEAHGFGSLSQRLVRISKGKLSQNVAVVISSENTPEEEKSYYSLSFLVKKPRIGAFTAKIKQGSNVLNIFELPANTDATWQSVKIEGILPTASEITVEFEHADAINNSFVELSDIMLANSKTAQNWTMSQGEIANNKVIIDEKGIVVNSSIHDGDYTAITPLEFSGYSGGERIFTLNKDTTEVKKLKAEDELNMTPIKIVAIKTGEVQGWAFVANERRD